MANNRLVQSGITLRDARGQTGRVSWWYVLDDSAAVNVYVAQNKNILIGTEFAALSNALIVNRFGFISQFEDPSAYGDQDDFQNVEDKAVLTFISLGGRLARYSVPAPILAMFAADTETVDPAQAAVATLITEVTAVDAHGGQVATRHGEVITDFVAGARTRRPFQRKTTLWTKVPAETGHEE